MTRPRRLVGPLAAAVLAAWVTAPCAHMTDDWGRILAPRGGAVVAGATAEIRWTALPADIDEFELLLSLDDGRSFSIRLTPQLDPQVGTFSWRVPNLPAARARLRLRVGREGREVEGPPGPAFAIVGDPGLPGSGLEHRAGEWWPVASSQAVATWVSRSPSDMAAVMPLEPEVGEGWIGPRSPLPGPAPTRVRSELPVATARRWCESRPELGRPVPDPPLRP